MPRQTRAEADAEIVDRAAGLFARHGFANTSLQQVADEVGYSKAGLLYHFANKEAIYQAAIRATRDQLEILLDDAEEVPSGAARDRVIVEALTDLTFAWPGVSTFLNSMVGVEDLHEPDLVEAGTMMARAFDIDPTQLSAERLIRVVSASAGLTVSALQAVTFGLTREWRHVIIDSAMSALGHSSTCSQPPGSSV